MKSLSTTSLTRPVLCALACAAGLALVAQVGCASNPQNKAATQFREGLDRDRIASDLADQADRARLAGDAEKAIALYRESLDYSSKFADVWNNLGLLQLEQDEVGKAINSFVQASILDPNDPRPLSNAGIASSRIGWEEDAMKYYHDALAIQPGYLPALRGAIRSADLLGAAQYEDLERVKRALLSETDTKWRTYFERQRFLIESRLRSSADRRQMTQP